MLGILTFESTKLCGFLACFEYTRVCILCACIFCVRAGAQQRMGIAAALAVGNNGGLSTQQVCDACAFLLGFCLNVRGCRRIWLLLTRLAAAHCISKEAKSRASNTHIPTLAQREEAHNLLDTLSLLISAVPGDLAPKWRGRLAAFWSRLVCWLVDCRCVCVCLRSALFGNTWHA